MHNIIINILQFSAYHLYSNLMPEIGILELTVFMLIEHKLKKLINFRTIFWQGSSLATQCTLRYITKSPRMQIFLR